MKICPRCQKTYVDDNLNYCLNDGANLAEYTDDAPPTVMLNRARTTQQNWENVQTPASWQNQPLQQQNQSYHLAQIQGRNQSLPTISLALGIFAIVSTCCYSGVPLGLAALVTRYLGSKNASENPAQFGGRNLVVGGIVTGVIG